MQTCESCSKQFDITIMHADTDCNWFCPDCWNELAPVMKAEYEAQQCYKTDEPCKYNCTGLCKESC